MATVRADGQVTRGHRVASGLGGDARFPEGTIALQLPFFRAALPGFDHYLGGPAHPGTLNVAFAGRVVRLGQPELRIDGVRWSPAVPAENFLLSRCTLAAGGGRHPAFLYVPDPATKIEHPQPRSVVELIAAFIPDLPYGAAVMLLHDPAAFTLEPAPAAG